MTHFISKLYNGNTFIPLDSIAMFWEGDRNQINLDTIWIKWVQSAFPFTPLTNPLFFHGIGNSMRFDSSYAQYSDGSIYLTHRSFDENDYPKDYVAKLKTPPTWSNYEHITYRYDDHGNCLEVIQMIPKGSSEWDNFRKWSYNFNDQDQLTHWNVVDWDTLNQKWIDFSRFVEEYDNGHWVKETREAWDNSQWVKSQISEFDYDDNGNIISYLQKIWKNDDWENDFMYNYKYDVSNNLASTTYQEWDGNAWNVIEHDEFFYDDNVLTRSTMDYLNSSTGIVQKYYQFNYEYNDYGQCSLLYSKTWNGSQYELTANSDARVNFYYEEFTPSAIKESINENEILLYPNPAVDQITVSLANTHTEISLIRIVDMKGRVVFQTNGATGTSHVAVPVGQLPGGNYIVQVNSGNKTGAKAFVIAR